MREDRPVHGKLILIVSFALGIAYILAGIGIIVVPADVMGLTDSVKIALGSLLILYGIFRTVRAYKQRTS